MKYYILYILFAISLLACQSDVGSNNSSPKEEQNTAVPPLSLNQFLINYKQATAGEQITPALSQRYIQPALEAFQRHPYLDTAIYNYGEIVYQDSLLAVVTFYYKATAAKNLMAAAFVASYSKQNSQLIDSKMVFGSSIFNEQEHLGYKLGFSCKSDLNFIDEEGYLLLLTNTIEESYSQQTIVPKKENKKYQKQYKMNLEGTFELM